MTIYDGVRGKAIGPSTSTGHDDRGELPPVNACTSLTERRFFINNSKWITGDIGLNERQKDGGRPWSEKQRAASKWPAVPLGSLTARPGLQRIPVRVQLDHRTQPHRRGHESAFLAAGAKLMQPMPSNTLPTEAQYAFTLKIWTYYSHLCLFSGPRGYITRAHKILKFRVGY
jgi:hypothetical protein